MKAYIIRQLRYGDELYLKPERAAAYGMPDRLVHFERIQERPGYSVPWVIATGGSYKPSDFSHSKPGIR